MVSGIEAIQRLKDGNKRFVSGVRSIDNMIKQSQREEFVEGQAPFAIILGCADSRVPAEIVFDQGLGDLFVIRVAGNIVAPSQVGSIEFATDTFGTALVVVLGHSQCGAVKAAIEELKNPKGAHSFNLLSIVNRIMPTVEPLFHTELRHQDDKLLDASVHANILASTNQLRHGSARLEQLVQEGKLTIIGAEYSLKTGIVTFIEGL